MTMVLWNTETDITDPDDWIHEKVNEFQYLCVCLDMKSEGSLEIGVKIIKAERASFALSNFFKSKIKKTNIRLYTLMSVRAILTHGCKL